MTNKVLTTEVVFVEQGKTLLEDEQAITVRVQDESGGPFLVLMQDQTQWHSNTPGVNEIRVDMEMLQEIAFHGKMMITQFTG